MALVTTTDMFKKAYEGGYANAAVRPGRARKQAVCVWKSGVEQGDQVVFEHGLNLGTLLVLPVCGF